MKILPIRTTTMSPSFLLRKQIEEEIMEYFNLPNYLREDSLLTEQEALANLKYIGEQFASTKI